ncbi:MAG: carboxypeptidase regulatory-like domain-containing protein, partial [Flavobacteriia bacterium]|nr:carboxypeptidase regulatory-like domain-containing protein [Flavobacteriia bacterium]
MTRYYLVVFLSVVSLAVFGQRFETVTGILKDQKTEDPIEKVGIKLTTRDSVTVAKAETDENGVYVFKNIPIGKYLLIVDDKDYEKKGFHAELKAEQAAKSDTYTFSPFMVSLKVSWLFNWGDSGNQEHYWSHFTAKIILIIYGACLVLVFFYSILQLSLSIAYARNRKKKAVE